MKTCFMKKINALLKNDVLVEYFEYEDAANA